MKIGSVQLEHPITQAALAGYSDSAMRAIARRHGASYTLCEVMLDRFITQVSRGKKAKRFFNITEEDHPCGAQIMGAAADDFVPAATRLVEAGFDVIDLNFGCPVKKVLGRQRGGFLLGEPEKALTIVDRVREVLPPEVPVTVKMRRGIDDSQESRDHFYTILDGAFARGIAAVTVHGRTVRQKYEGKSSWEFLREVKQHLGDRTMLGSGDLFTAQDCIDMMQQTGVDGVTIARGGIGNPWIFREAKALYEGTPLPCPPTLQEQRAIVEEHYQMTADIYGPERGIRQMRKFCIKYAELHPSYPDVRTALIKIKRTDDLKAVLDKWYPVSENN